MRSSRKGPTVAADETDVDERLHLVGHNCPMNFVYTKLKLEEMREGQTLEVIVANGEPARNVPRSVEAEGHVILEQKPEGDHFLIRIRKVGE